LQAGGQCGALEQVLQLRIVIALQAANRDLLGATLQSSVLKIVIATPAYL
jgi:hypothetical protein